MNIALVIVLLVASSDSKSLRVCDLRQRPGHMRKDAWTGGWLYYSTPTWMPCWIPIRLPKMVTEYLINKPPSNISSSSSHRFRFSKNTTQVFLSNSSNSPIFQSHCLPNRQSHHHVFFYHHSCLLEFQGLGYRPGRASTIDYESSIRTPTSQPSMRVESECGGLGQPDATVRPCQFVLTMSSWYLGGCCGLHILQSIIGKYQSAWGFSQRRGSFTGSHSGVSCNGNHHLNAVHSSAYNFLIIS